MEFIHSILGPSRWHMFIAETYVFLMVKIEHEEESTHFTEPNGVEQCWLRASGMTTCKWTRTSFPLRHKANIILLPVDLDHDNSVLTTFTDQVPCHCRDVERIDVLPILDARRRYLRVLQSKYDDLKQFDLRRYWHLFAWMEDKQNENKETSETVH